MTDRGSIKEFFLERKEDESGVSGTGRVARGVQLPSGKVVLEWTTARAPVSQAFYESVEELLAIHGHEGKTLLKWANKQESQFCESSYRKGLRTGLLVGCLCGIVIGGCLLFLL